MPLRVLHVYSGNLYGGVERMLATLASPRAAVDGVRQAFALCFSGRLADELRAAHAEVHLLAPVRMSRPWTAVRARRALDRLIRNAPPDVVICHSSWTHALFAPVAQGRRTPVVFWLHDAVTGRPWTDRLARRARPDLAICTSAFAAKTLGRLWADVPWRVLYPPVLPPSGETVDRQAIRTALGVAAGDAVILQASRMEPWKGHRLLIQALGTLRDTVGWTCWIAGGAQRPHEAAHLAEMRALADSVGVADRVRFLGQRDDVRALMAAADVLCQPNLAPEPFGIAYVEALHAGLPVVATALGGPREIVDATCGVLVPPGDAAALGDALRALVADPARRAALGAAGPFRAAALCDAGRQARTMAEFVRPLVRR